MRCTVIVLCSVYFLSTECQDLLIKINGRSVSLSKHNGDSYNLYVDYDFFEDEPVYFTCVKNTYDDALMTMKTNVFQLQNFTIDTIKTEGKGVIYLRLTQESHGKYIVCNLTKESNERSTVATVNLYNKGTKPAFYFLINQHILVKKGPYNSTYNLFFEYEYFGAEVVEVKSFLNKHIYKSIKCKTTTFEPDFRPCFSFSKKFERDSLTKYVIPCEIRKSNINEIDKVLLRFVPSNGIPQGMVNAVKVKGISINKVLAMYNKTGFEFSIVYDYSGNEEEQVFIDYDDPVKTIAAQIDTNVIRLKQGNMNGTYKLKPEKRFGIISAHKLGETQFVTKIILLRRTHRTNIEKAISMEENTNMNSTYNITNLKHVRKNSKDPNINMKDSNMNLPNSIRKNYVDNLDPERVDHNTYTDPQEKQNWPFVIGVIITLAIVVVFVYVIIKLLKKRRQIQKNINNYEHLLKRDGQSPNISQEAKYAVPFDKLPENTNYAVPFKPTLEEMYTKPIPKKDRKRMLSEDDKNDTNDVTYAELESLPDVACSIDIKKSQVQYSEIRQPINNENYYNVFDNEKYKNFKEKSEYAEPAYCELGEVLK